MRRRWRGRIRGDDEGEDVGIVETVLVVDACEETMLSITAGRPVRTREVVFIFAAPMGSADAEIDMCNSSAVTREAAVRIGRRVTTEVSERNCVRPYRYNERPNCRTEEQGTPPALYRISDTHATLNTGTVSPYPLYATTAHSRPERRASHPSHHRYCADT